MILKLNEDGSVERVECSDESVMKGPHNMKAHITNILTAAAIVAAYFCTVSRAWDVLSRVH